MPRYTHDTDEERLPEGMTRIGYDADTQTYTFKDADGSFWESAPGNQYGRLHRVGSTITSDEDDDDPEAYLLEAEYESKRPSWRRDMMPFLNFGVIIGVFLLGLFWFMSGGGSGEGGMLGGGGGKITCGEGETVYKIEKGDTCWEIAQGRGIDIKDILAVNEGVECERLRVGGRMCLPGRGEVAG